MSADRLPCSASFLKSFHSVSCYRATAHGRNLFCTGGMCAGNSASAFRPSSFLSPCRPRLHRKRRPVHSARALLDGFFGFPPLRRHRRARCEKNERRGDRAGGHTSLANGADRPVTNPEGFAAQEFGRRDNGQSETSVQCSTVHSVAFLPSSHLQLVIENTDSKQKNR